ncbi:hypothetical protein [uncultured Rikenella sp.]|uniref:hypothetical protein n=1 Tax=uncultured Rikenella sp. TaxID=368003 RepID=UPI002633DE63|nr:hypothetical protein [uncultured Rikenella sp.]
MPSGTAPGYRHRTSGEPNYVGYEASSWTTTISDNDYSLARRLVFNATDLDASGTYGHAGGFQLRCLSE